MRKLAFVVALTSLTSAVCAADFSLQNLKACDISVKAEAAVLPVPSAPRKVQARIPQELVDKFFAVKNELQRLNNNTTWLRSDIDRLENKARRIAQTNTADPYFQNELQSMSSDMARYNNNAQSIGSGVKNLLTSAQKDAELNTIARDMDGDARTLLNRVQFDIENAAQRLEGAVRGAKPEIIGYNAQWVAGDISRYSRDLAWKLHNISNDAQTLLSNTQP